MFFLLNSITLAQCFNGKCEFRHRHSASWSESLHATQSHWDYKNKTEISLLFARKKKVRHKLNEIESIKSNFEDLRRWLGSLVTSKSSIPSSAFFFVRPLFASVATEILCKESSKIFFSLSTFENIQFTDLMSITKVDTSCVCKNKKKKYMWSWKQVDENDFEFHLHSLSRPPNNICGVNKMTQKRYESTADDRTDDDHVTLAYTHSMLSCNLVS